MQVERNSNRIYPKDYKDFKVQLVMADVTFEGFVGNVSEDGMCVILPPDLANLDVPEHTFGAIKSGRIAAPIEFSGTVLWLSRQDYKGQTHLLSGIQFDESVELPDAMIAISYAINAE